MIRVLKNPKTFEYLKFKESVLSEFFPWFWNTGSTRGLEKDGYVDVKYYSHTLLSRPEGPQKHSQVVSDYFDSYLRVVEQIFKYNNLSSDYFFLRAGLNCVHPMLGIQKTVPHIDHDIPHKNVIIYFTDAGGSTHVEGEKHDPSEDDVCLFVGEHFFELPKNDRRIVVVGTFVDF